MHGTSEQGIEDEGAGRQDLAAAEARGGVGGVGPPTGWGVGPGSSRPPRRPQAPSASEPATMSSTAERRDSGAVNAEAL
jgi:hypothetical protein